MKKSLVLASQSPRRKELLSQLGYQFKTQSANIDEGVLQNESPEGYVVRLSIEKAKVVSEKLTSSIQDSTVVLGSDTCVVANNKILGKPENLAECIEHLSLLSGTTHQVFTAVALVQGSKVLTTLVTTHVQFKTLTKHEIIAYWHTNEPQDKAGSYGIQGIGGQFVKQINGSYSAVVGLPLYETADLLNQFNLPSALQPEL